ncbi:MAG: hypothetical protein M1119_00990 [Firmicutes bacterium]|nr:hypothetical protein [Bacillota bacterium]
MKIEYRTIQEDGDYENIATGESKEWAPEKFNGQLKQLLGYLREEGGFGGVKLYPVLFLQKLKQEYVALCRITCNVIQVMKPFPFCQKEEV